MKEYLDFLATVPPYDALPSGERERLVRGLEVEYAARGHRLREQGEAPAAHTWVVRSGALEVLDGDHVVDVLGPGDSVDGQGTVRAAEDSLLYRVPTVAPAPARPPGAPVATRWARPVTVVRPDDPIRDVARRITDDRTSCAVVAFPDGPGVVTDGDVRRRVGTGEVSPDAPVSVIASRAALTAGPTTSVTAALLTMVEHGVHHLVVVDDLGVPAGVLRAVDLTSAEVRDPLAVRAAVDAAGDLDALASVVAGLGAAVVELHDTGLPPLRVAGLLAAVLDGVVRRVMHLGGHLAGEPASLLALGSLARREVLPSSDVDTALVWDDDLAPDLRPAVAHLLDDLERVGLRRCPEGANADDARYGRPLRDWRAATAAWSRDPTRDAGLLLMTMLAGSRPLTAPELAARAVAGLAALRDNVAFRKTVLDYTLAGRPPLGFVRGVVVQHDGEHRGRLDLKAGGLRPVTAIARWAAVLAPDGPTTGLTTVEHLRAAAASGLLGSDEGESLVHAYEHLFGLALHTEVEALRRGEPPTTWIDPAALDGLSRRLLREAFRTVARVQGHLESDWAPRWR